MMRAVIVDDESLPRERIRQLLAEYGNVALVGEAGDALTAIALIEAERPDLLLLDIQMPGLDGFAVLEALGAACPPAVVFVTAYDVHALRAFDTHAVDYVLKPIQADRFRRALDRAVERLSAHETTRRTDALLASREEAAGGLTRFAVRIGDRVRFVPVDAVEWLEAADNYVRLHTGHERLPVRITMRELEQRLPAARFARVHRSAIVNVQAIRQARAADHGELHLELASGATLRVSRTYVARLRPLLR